MDAGGVFATVVVLADDREVEPRVGDAQGGPVLGRVPRQSVHPIPEGDGLALALLLTHGQLLDLRPALEEFLHPGRGRRLRGGIPIGGVVLGAGHGDVLLTAQHVREEGVTEHRRVAELAPVPGMEVPADLGQLGGLVLVVGGEQLVGGEALLVLRGHPHGLGLGERAPVGHTEGVAVDRLVVQPRPGVDDDAAQAHRCPSESGPAPDHRVRADSSKVPPVAPAKKADRKFTQSDDWR
ncbi:hypothetical protein SANTM175S_04253 [Streptomyces antimycoticus]